MYKLGAFEIHTTFRTNKWIRTDQLSVFINWSRCKQMKTQVHDEIIIHIEFKTQHIVSFNIKSTHIHNRFVQKHTQNNFKTNNLLGWRWVTIVIVEPSKQIFLNKYKPLQQIWNLTFSGKSQVPKQCRRHEHLSWHLSWDIHMSKLFFECFERQHISFPISLRYNGKPNSTNFWISSLSAANHPSLKPWYFLYHFCN